MPRLLDMLNLSNSPESQNTPQLEEALGMLIEMVKENALKKNEMALLESTVDALIESIQQNTQALVEKKMSANELKVARRYRLKNRAKLARIAAKKKVCMDKLREEGKQDKFSCGSDGRRHPIDKQRSRAAKLGARSR
jgi:hypothetical protein